MARWLLAALLAFLLVLGLWAGYQGYTRFLALEGKVAALEARVAAQEEALKALGDRVGRLEAEAFQAPTPPLSLPEVPEAPGAPAWPYAVGVVGVVLLLYLALRLWPRGEKPPREGEKPEVSQEEARMEEEGAPPKG
ncbi:MAG: hypothetical protein NZ846_06105 [Thermus sp.]|uniref:hypothetical protein n=1 Tax=Thermus sp. TaxID=275 RepID=UPI0025F8E33B|nr:hypothetical protein [Thermus sp.]MCS6867517.1 hypothetical protein [Thermus sp.]MCS7218535.1 hypothetical protein [Thermus sp.]MDW8017700.1 hypothetical protein [Thermus sp.]